MPALSRTIAAEHVVDLAEGDREAVLRRLAELGAAAAELDPQPLLQAVIEREALASTGFGEGLAMPHVRLRNGVDGLHAVLARTRAGIPFDAADGAPVQLFLFVLGSDRERERYQQLMARAARFLKEEGPRLIAAEDFPCAAREALVDY